MPSSARVILNVDLPGPVISRHLYGHFAEHLGRCIWPGGCFADGSPPGPTTTTSPGPAL